MAALLILVLLGAAGIMQATTLPRTMLCYRAAAPIRVDGSLSDAAWRNAPWSEPFVDIEGDIRPRPWFTTRVKLLWDDRFLYIGAELEEPHVWATLTKRDSVIFQDPDFEVFIDPDGDNHNYFEIEINALNTVWDLRLPKPYRDGGPAISEWDIRGLRSAVRVYGAINDPLRPDRGWTVEMAIPWAALAEHAGCPAPPRDGDQWRMNFSRVQWLHYYADGRYRKVEGKPEENWVWSPQGVVDMHRPERWGIVQFTRSAPGRGRFVPDSTLAARDLAMRIYYAQREYHKKQRRWAANLEALGIGGPYPAGIGGAPRIALTADGWRATVPVGGRGARGRVVTVTQDSRLVVEPRPRD
jgi:hypothetical protein